jgi:hypothetical protein
MHLFIIVTLPLQPAHAVSAKKSTNPACVTSTASTVIKHNSWLIAVCRKGTEFTVPGEIKRQCPCNNSQKHAASLRAINTVIHLIPVNLKSTTSQCTSFEHPKEILLLQVPNFTVPYSGTFAVSPPRILWSGFETGPTVTKCRHTHILLPVLEDSSDFSVNL